jgi:GH43 family beta-xylosidase
MTAQTGFSYRKKHGVFPPVHWFQLGIKQLQLKQLRHFGTAVFLMIGALSLTACVGPLSDAKGSGSDPVADGFFTNPLFSNGADPWLEYYDGNYYLTTTTWTSQLVMRKSPTLAGLATATPVNIWSHANPERCCNFWAFEFHRLNGPNGPRWYVMYTSGQHGTLDHQHLSVIESVGDDPMGPYTYKGSFMPDSWNIDGTYLKHDGQLYLVWSEWVGDEQLNWISKMTNPWTITGPRQIITRPTYEWEKSGRKVNEGAEILKKDGRTFMVYSASFCDTPDYKLALMELTGNDPMNPDHWHKFPEPVFQKANGVFGPGHNGFFTSPDGSEDWIVYHGNSSAEHGCGATRSVRAQPFTWTEEGLPNFGEPVSEATEVQVPSGEDGPLVTEVQGAAYKLVSRSADSCLAADGSVGSCDADANQWIVDPTTDGYIRLANPSTGKFLGYASCDNEEASLEQSAWMNSACQQWRLEPTTDGWWQLSNRDNDKFLEVCKVGENGDCEQWRLQPAQAVALSSAQSGRVVEVEACSTKPGANIAQREWDYQDCQQWRFSHADNGYYQLTSAHAPGACMTVAGDSVVPGANVEQGSCESPSSQWRLDLLPGGGVHLINRPSGLALNLASCGLADGTNLALAPVMNSTCQRFHLRAVD